MTSCSCFMVMRLIMVSQVVAVVLRIVFIGFPNVSRKSYKAGPQPSRLSERVVPVETS